MNVRRLVILGLSAVAAVVLALVLRVMVAPKPQPAAVMAAAPVAEKPMAQVLVAKRDLPVGARVKDGDLGWQPWPVAAVNAAYITDGAPAPVPTSAAAKVAKAAETAMQGGGVMSAFDGAVVREALLAGEPVTPAKLVRGGEGGFMAVVLQPGMRAMSVPVTVETGAGGFILPGDRVDVIQSRTAPGGPEGVAGGPVSRTVLGNLRVLAIDQTTKPDKDAQTVVGATATLEVPSGYAEALARAKAGGELTLALRSYADVGGPAVVASNDGGDRPETIKIFRAGQASDVTVSQ